MFEIVSDTAGSEVKFDEHGDGLARYEILNFRKSEHNGTNGYQYQASENTRTFSLFEIRKRSEKKFLAHARSNIFLLLLGLNEEGGERIIVGGSLEPV